MPFTPELGALSAKVLLVDDDRRLLHAVKLRLDESGCRCAAFSNTNEALSHFTVSPVDVIITDLDMPGIDGVGIISMIRAQSEVPIIVITGFSADAEPDYTQYRNVSIIRKPFEMTHLVQSLYGTINTWRKAAPAR